MYSNQFITVHVNALSDFLRNPISATQCQICYIEVPSQRKMNTSYVYASKIFHHSFKRLYQFNEVILYYV